MFSTGDLCRGLLLAHSMSEESAPTPEQEPAPQATETPRVRRISNPRPKKQAKAKDAEPATEAATESSAPVEVPTAPAAEVSESSDDSSESNDWPEAEPATVGGQPQGEGGSKRKRRRKKGKGNQNAQNNPQQGSFSADGEPTIETVVENAPQGHQHRQPQPQPPQPQRPKVDPELLAKFAWKIYLSEVSEEGIALISDNDAREISRRCFRMAEIFLEEQGRRR